MLNGDLMKRSIILCLVTQQRAALLLPKCREFERPNSDSDDRYRTFGLIVSVRVRVSAGFM